MYTYDKVFYYKFSGDKSWSEGVVALFPLLSISDDGIANEDLDFLVVPQYGRNADHTG